MFPFPQDDRQGRLRTARNHHEMTRLNHMVEAQPFLESFQIPTGKGLLCGSVLSDSPVKRPWSRDINPVYQ